MTLDIKIPSGHPFSGLCITTPCPTPGCGAAFSAECLSSWNFSAKPRDNPHILYGCPECCGILYAHYDKKKNVWSMRPAKEGAI